MEILDYHTVMAGDKFGNVFVLRWPSEVSDDDLGGAGGSIGGSGNSAVVTNGLHHSLYNTVNSLSTPKLHLLAHYYLGEIVTHFSKVSSPSSSWVCATTILGSIVAFRPLVTKEDLDFFQSMEMWMRQEAGKVSGGLVGRDHLSYRSFYQPVRNVVDGDLCQQFYRLTSPLQQSLAEQLDRTLIEIKNKLEDVMTIL